MALYVHAWIGSFKSRADFERYIQQTYSANGESVPSQFMLDVGLAVYDHDRQEFEYHETPLPLAEVLTGHSYAASFSAAFIKRATELGIDSAGTVFLLYDGALSPKSPDEIAPIRYVGAFDYTTD